MRTASVYTGFDGNIGWLQQQHQRCTVVSTGSSRVDLTMGLVVRHGQIAVVAHHKGNLVIRRVCAGTIIPQDLVALVDGKSPVLGLEEGRPVGKGVNGLVGSLEACAWLNALLVVILGNNAESVL